MAHRTQITLRDDQYRRLRDESRRLGVSLAELIRRAIEQQYGRLTVDEKLRALDESFGGWSEDAGEDRAAYVRELRGPGLGHRLGGDGDARAAS